MGDFPGKINTVNGVLCPPETLLWILRKKCEWLEGFAAAIGNNELKHAVTNELRRLLKEFEAWWEEHQRVSHPTQHQERRVS